jgi:hypothetical protein
MTKHEGMTVDQLIAESQALGAQVDKIKEQRRVLKMVIDAKLKTPVAAPGQKDAKVEGVNLTVESTN